MSALRNPTWWVGVGLLVIAIFFAVVANQWEIDRRLFPWVIAFPVIGFAVLHTLLGLRRDIDAEVEALETHDGKSLLNARLKLFAWVAGLLVLMTIIGLHAAVPVFVFVFMVWHGESKVLASISAFVMWLFVFGLLDNTMHILFPRPYISIWLNL